MASGLLETLTVQGYRGFANLKLHALGRVNLVVGRNNVGKSSLLEALYLLATHASSTALQRVLRARSEVAGGEEHQLPGRPSRERMLVGSLFFRGPDLTLSGRQVWLGPGSGPQDGVSLQLGWCRRQGDPGNPYVLVEGEAEQDEMSAQPALVIRTGSDVRRIVALQPDYSVRTDFLERYPWSFRALPPCIYVGSEQLPPDRVGYLWDAIALTDLEDEVLAALQVIEPRVVKLSVIGGPGGEMERAPVVRLGEGDRPVFLKTMGDGMTHVLGLALALTNAGGGMALLDEVENGIHYSVQTDLWKLIFHLARRLSIQVFATTHSWDCVEAFQKAAAESPGEDGLLIRLYQGNEGIAATTFSEQELTIATRQGIEVRG